MAIQKWNVANAKYLRHKNQKKSTNKSSSSGMVFAYEYSLFGETKTWRKNEKKEDDCTNPGATVKEGQSEEEKKKK